MDASQREWLGLTLSAGLLVLALAVLATGLWLWLRLRRNLIGHEDAVATILHATGDVRLMGAAGLLLDLARRGDAPALAAAWRKLEGPLAAALPTASGPVRLTLAKALDAAAERSAGSDLGRSLAAFRRACG